MRILFRILGVNLSGFRQRALAFLRAPYFFNSWRFIMKIEAGLKYTEKDEWVRVEGNFGFIGISDYAQDQLSDIVYLEYLVSEGEEIGKGDEIGTIESVKAASEIYSPVSGTVVELNEDLLDTPETVNSDPYGEAWMIKVELSDTAELDSLMDAAAYEKNVEERES
jgi:glycine cleavage system H protein